MESASAHRYTLQAAARAPQEGRRDDALPVLFWPSPTGLRLEALRWVKVILASSHCVESASSYVYESAAPPPRFPMAVHSPSRCGRCQCALPYRRQQIKQRCGIAVHQAREGVRLQLWQGVGRIELGQLRHPRQVDRAIGLGPGEDQGQHAPGAGAALGGGGLVQAQGLGVVGWAARATVCHACAFE